MIKKLPTIAPLTRTINIKHALCTTLLCILWIILIQMHCRIICYFWERFLCIYQNTVCVIVLSPFMEVNMFVVMIRQWDMLERFLLFLLYGGACLLPKKLPLYSQTATSKFQQCRATCVVVLRAKQLWPISMFLLHACGMCVEPGEQKMSAFCHSYLIGNKYE